MGRSVVTSWIFTSSTLWMTLPPILRARVVEVARQLGLAVDDDGIAAGIFVQIDAIQPAVVGDEEAFVDLALAVHALAALRLAHQRGEAMLQHAGADAPRAHIRGCAFRARHCRCP
jgi:hypothetical protein